MLATLGVFFALTFAYQVIKTVEVTRLVAQANSGLQNNAAQAQVLADSAWALTHISRSNSELARERQLEASEFAELAKQRLERRERAFRTQREKPSTAADVALSDAIMEVLFASHVAYGRANYFLHRYGRVTNSADRLLELNSERWEGYHLLGLARIDQGDTSDEVVAIFSKSTDFGPASNVDRLNLAEIHFVREEWELCITAIEEYRRRNPEPSPAMRIMGDLYEALSNYLLGNDETELGTDMQDKINELLAHAKGQFSAVVLRNFLLRVEERKALENVDIRRRNTVARVLAAVLTTDESGDRR